MPCADCRGIDVLRRGVGASGIWWEKVSVVEMMQYYSGFDPTSWGSNVIHLAPTSASSRMWVRVCVGPLPDLKRNRNVASLRN